MPRGAVVVPTRRVHGGGSGTSVPVSVATMCRAARRPSSIKGKVIVVVSKRTVDSFTRHVAEPLAAAEVRAA